MNLNPKERLLRTIRGQKSDLVPLELLGFRYKSLSDINKLGDPLKQKIARRIFDQTHYFINVPSRINRYLMTPPQRIKQERTTLPDGCQRTCGVINTPKGDLNFEEKFAPKSNTVWKIKYPVETREDIDKIASVVWELPKGLSPPDISDLPEDFQERGIIRTSISSPFVCVAGMMKYEMFLEMCLTEPDSIAELTEICQQRIANCLEVLLSKPGIEYVWLGGSEWLTPPMASSAIYDALVQEQERSLIEYIRNNSDAVVDIHCHGNVRDALPKTIDRGADYTEPVEPPPDGDITMIEAKKIAAGRITLGGNIETRILFNGSQDEVEKAVRAAFEGGKERFILRPTATPSPKLSQREFLNYQKMIDVWEELSPY